MENTEKAFGVIFVEIHSQINAAGRRTTAYQVNQEIEVGKMSNTQSAGLGLTENERNICRLLNVTEEEYVKTRDGKVPEAGSMNRSGIGNARALTTDERKICAQMGVSEEEYLKTAAR